jgi:uncharacterized protein
MTADDEPARPRLLLDGHIEVRETHISWVFLTGDRAYKIKKPVVLPYLDYGTPERRRAMCEAEVALNRRLAPDVYLGVRALVPAYGGLRLADPDRAGAVDYAVEMLRYDERDTLASRLAANAAGTAEIVAVGERLAVFHAAATPVPRADGAEAVKRALDDNFATLHGLAPDRAAIARLERSAGAFLSAHWDDLDARAASGRVREGHGDLRLEHVLLGEDVQFVDCVEFDPGLRRIDVAADLAFLVMELHESGQREPADVLVQSYRAAGGDVGSDALIAFFAAYRAEVRAKVALERADQLADESGDEARRHTSRLLALAGRLRWAAATPLVVALAGVSASGKSTVAGSLADASGFALVSSDIVRKSRAGLRPTDRAPERLYSDAVSRATYTELGSLAAAASGRGVIVDATFRRRADRDAFRRGLGDGMPVLFVECRAPATVLESRARARDTDPDRISDAGLQIVRRQLASTEPLDEVPPADHVIVRSDRPVATIVDAIGGAIDARTANTTVVSRTRTRASRAVTVAVA